MLETRVPSISNAHAPPSPQKRDKAAPNVVTQHRVYIVDDEEAVRHSLSVLLETEGYRVASFGAAPDFLAAASSLPAGVLISDIRMPEMDGLELQRHLGERMLRFPVILITGHADVPLAVQAMKAGAVDFIEKPFPAEAIIDAVAAAQSRLSAVAPEMLAQAAASRLSALSARERQVLDGLVAGLPNKSIAYDLAISPRTVEIHRASVMRKMQAASLSELIRLALAAAHPRRPGETRPRSGMQPPSNMKQRR